MALVTLARLAMATRFEIVLHGEDPARLRAAGEEALNEIDRLEAQLSLYRPESEISRLNARAAREAVHVSPSLFGLLEHARQLHGESGGAFDITVAPLVRCWGFMGGGGRRPSAGELAEARTRVGMGLVRLDPEKRTVRFARDGVMLDLGAIGKGYAIEQAVELLREAGVTSALLHGGTSTVYALGHPPEAGFWNVAVDNPARALPVPAPAGQTNAASPGHELLAVVPLKDEALSVSAVRGKFFSDEGKIYGHVLDPRTGQPAGAALLAAVALPSATETDALSTALLTLGAPGHETIGKLRPGMRTLLVSGEDGGWQVHARGIAVHQKAV